MWFLYQLAELLTHSAKVAKLAVWYLLLFPTGFILSSFYTESLFLMLSLGMFLSLEKKEYGQAALWAILGSLTRSPGFLLFVPVCFQVGTEFVATKKIEWQKWLAVLMLPVGLLGWLGFSYWRTGSFLAPFMVQTTWQKTLTWPWISIFRPLNYIGHVSLFEKYLTLLWSGLTILSFKWFKDKKYWFYSGVMLLLPLVSGTLISISRYMLVIFPIFIFLAHYGQKWPTLNKIIQVSFWTVQVLFFVAWCRFYWVV